MCLFEENVCTNFGEVAGSASVMKNQGGRLKVKGLCEGKETATFVVVKDVQA